MKAIKKIFPIFLLLLASCQEDETLNLRDYPNVSLSISALNAKDPLNGIYKATYNEDRTLTVDSEVGFTVALSTPTTSEVTANLVYDVKNIPGDKLTFPKQIVFPVGAAEQRVKLEDFSFMTDLTAQDYEVNVKVASIEGGKCDVLVPSPVKLLIQKEAFSTSLQLTSKQQSYTFDRIYANGQIINKDKMNFTFKAQLTMALDTDLEIAMDVANLTDQQKANVTFSPASIVIPAGSLVSEDITCHIADDFLLESAEDETYNVVLSAKVAGENSLVDTESEKNQIHVTITKSSNILQQIERGNNWLILNREGWNVTLGEGVLGNGRNILDDDNYGTGISTNGVPLSFSVELPQKVNVDFLEINCGQFVFFPTSIRISTSEDGVEWKSLGTLSIERMGNWRESSFFIKFLAPVASQYYKYEVVSSSSFTRKVTDFKLYQK